MIHNEHLFKADTSYEIRFNSKGDVIHVHIKDGAAIIYPSLTDFIEHQISGMDSERFYLKEENLSELYATDIYSYYELKKWATENIKIDW